MTLQRIRDYELVMILSPEATESEAAQTVRRISDIISDGGGSISQQENWGIRRLAYPIQRFIEGNYFITRCRMEAQAAADLDKTLNAAQDVMRHLVFRLEKSEIAAMEAQAERQRQELAKQEAEARAAAAREAREREAAAARIEAERDAEERVQAAPQPEAVEETAESESDASGEAEREAGEREAVAARIEAERDAEERAQAAPQPEVESEDASDAVAQEQPSEDAQEPQNPS